MKISNLGVANTSLPSQLPAEEIGAAGKDAPARGAAASAQSYTPSTELAQLIHVLKQQPQVRDQQVRNAIQRLQQGYYHTQNTAANTAGALLAARH
jgi:hypothetical protein